MIIVLKQEAKTEDVTRNDYCIKAKYYRKKYNPR